MTRHRHHHQRSQRPRLDVGLAFKNGWNAFTADIVPFLVGALIAGMLSVITLGILAGPLTAGLYNMAVRRMRDGRRAEIGDVFSCFDRFWSYLWAAIVLVVLIGLASLTIVGGVLLATIWIYVFPFMVDRRMGLGRGDVRQLPPGRGQRLLGAPGADRGLLRRQRRRQRLGRDHHHPVHHRRDRRRVLRQPRLRPPVRRGAGRARPAAAGASGRPRAAGADADGRRRRPPDAETAADRRDGRSPRPPADAGRTTTTATDEAATA